MDNLVDFEALIDINEVLLTMAKIEGEIQNITQNSLIDAFDKMCDEDDSKNTEVTNTDNKVTVEENTDSADDIINLDDFGDVFNEMQLSVDTLQKLGEREFSITDINTENFEEKMVEPVDEISKTTDSISENDPVVNLDEFEMIFNDICVSNDKIGNESIFSNTKTRKEETVTSNNVTDLDEMEGTANDDKIKKDKTNVTDDLKCSLENKTTKTVKLSETVTCPIIDLDEIDDAANDNRINNDAKTTVTNNLKPNDSKSSLENQTTGALELNKTDNYPIIDLDSTGSDIDNTKDEIEKGDLEINVITLSSDSEDDGYNSSDFEFITEIEAKKNCLAKTNIEDYAYYNADYKKYRKNKYFPCKVISSKAKRESHVIPQGETYLDLFRGMYAPAVLNNLHYASRKRVLPVTSMTIQIGGGFDVYENQFEENQEYKDEANESLKRIRSMYPDENRKRRRSRRF